MPYVRAAATEDVWQGEMVGVRVGAIRVLLVHLEDGFYAYVDRCAHQAVPLSEGKLDGEVIVCGAHGWSYDARSGQGVNPKTARLLRVPVRVESGEVFVDVEAARIGAQT